MHSFWRVFNFLDLSRVFSTLHLSTNDKACNIHEYKMAEIHFKVESWKLKQYISVTSAGKVSYYRWFVRLYVLMIIFTKFSQNPTHSKQDISRKIWTDRHTHTQIKFVGEKNLALETVNFTTYSLYYNYIQIHKWRLSEESNYFPTIPIGGKDVDGTRQHNTVPRTPLNQHYRTKHNNTKSLPQ